MQFEVIMFCSFICFRWNLKMTQLVLCHRKIFSYWSRGEIAQNAYNIICSTSNITQLLFLKLGLSLCFFTLPQEMGANVYPI